MTTETTTKPAAEPETNETTPVVADSKNPIHEGTFIPTAEWDEINWNLTDEPRIKHTSQVPTRLVRLLSGSWDIEKRTEPQIRNKNLALKSTSELALEKILEDDEIEDIEKARCKCLDRLVVPRHRLIPVVREMALIYPKSSISISGFFLYPPEGGYMGWHTNSDAPYTRVYVTHSEPGGESYFRYRVGGECVTSNDPVGWSMRQFQVSPLDDDPFWHCVYADTKRLSVGFRINRNLK